MTKLERMIDRQMRRDARNIVRANRLAAAAAKKKERQEHRDFKKRFGEHFAKLRRLVRVRIEGKQAQLTYKDQSYVISYEYWKTSWAGSDPGSMDGMRWELRREQPYSVEIIAYSHDTHDGPNFDHPKDLSKEVIDGIRWFNENKRHES